MRGYFGIGVEGSSKSGNLGNLLRTAHAFGASFFFAIASALDEDELRAVDTSAAGLHLPFTRFATVAELRLPDACQLVGIELTPTAISLPSFRHPLRAAYVLGPEKGSLSPELLARCAHVVQIPTRFCVNVGVAGAIAIYDRMLSLGQHAERPVQPGGPLPVDFPRPRRR